MKLRHTTIAMCLVLACSGQAMAQTAPDSLFQALGNEPGISKIVDEMLVEVMQDERIKASFKDTDMPRLAKLLKEQFCVISGGPCKYTGDDMKVVHENLGINAAQFYALAEDLQIAMDKLAVASSTQNKLMAKLSPMKKDIVFPKPKPQ
ncbi:group 1 truncated hemoglobin [Undibacterium sp. CY18W]|uniref:Group 1 truncated hemoglobin n=1 Tax=Undibacterium hunanense TaxID=2762292 RepID=A0ABR6ZLW6_9BURK|nr:group 1 truncated hemoglobin [Undibacterium hunanense]MBC3916886.1 group 1 truncated hemoglobin [Undibacterium hunanense]